MLLDSPQQHFIKYLQSNKYSLTPQRKIIAEVFLEEEGHFSVEHLTNRVKDRLPEIGQSTVYRTLKLLVDSGLADTIDLGDGVTLYEHGYGHEHHDHLICLKCSRKIEVLDPEIERRQEELAADNGFELTSHRMYLYGICPDCQRSKS